jgi:hypothetical protein
MAKTLPSEPTAIDILTGHYINEKDSSKTMVLFRKDNVLWIKGDNPNEVPFGFNLEFVGNNTFKISGIPVETWSFIFEILPAGVVKLIETNTNNKGEKDIIVYEKAK